MKERRRYPRVPVHYDVLYKNIDDTAKKNKRRAVAENASRTGLKIRYSGELKKDDLLELDIYKSLKSKPIHAYGKIVWEKESPLVYGEKMSGIFLTKIGWTETDKLITPDLP